MLQHLDVALVSVGGLVIVLGLLMRVLSRLPVSVLFRDRENEGWRNARCVDRGLSHHDQAAVIEVARSGPDAQAVASNVVVAWLEQLETMRLARRAWVLVAKALAHPETVLRRSDAGSMLCEQGRARLGGARATGRRPSLLTLGAHQSAGS